jgi:hypothetical protein
MSPAELVFMEESGKLLRRLKMSRKLQKLEADNKRNPLSKLRAMRRLRKIGAVVSIDVAGELERLIEAVHAVKNSTAPTSKAA